MENPLHYHVSFEPDVTDVGLFKAWQRIAERYPGGFKSWVKLSSSKPKSGRLRWAVHDTRYKRQSSMVFAVANQELIPPLFGPGTGPTAAARGRAVVALYDAIIEYYHRNYDYLAKRLHPHDSGGHE